MRVSRFVPSIPNRSASDVSVTPGGKRPPTPIGPTYPGPLVVGFVLSGLESTSRCVIVDWLMNWMARDDSGEPSGKSLENKAAVRASATAPSIAKTSSAVLENATPFPTPTPRISPSRSTTAMIAGLRIGRRGRPFTSNCTWAGRQHRIGTSTYRSLPGGAQASPCGASFVHVFRSCAIAMIASSSKKPAAKRTCLMRCDCPAYT